MFVFLDIDGVMVPAKPWSAPELLEDGFPAFSGASVEMLREILCPNDCIILTTSHKSRFSPKEWKAIFGRRGVQTGRMETLPENSRNLSRRDEILAWFNVHSPEENFIIIDDDKSLNALPGFLKNRLLLTSGMIGLNLSHREEIQVLLTDRREFVR